MLKQSSRLRHLINLGVALGFIIALIGLPQPVSHVAAQGGDGTPIAYGENKPGQVTAESTGTFFFEATAGDIAKITVLAFGFAPNFQILDANRTNILAIEANVANAESIEFNYPVTTTGRHYIIIRGFNGATGQFALSLARGVRDLPPGVLLVVNAPPVKGTLQTPELPLVYDIAANPDGSLILKVESATAGYNPIVTLLDQNGTVLFNFNNPRITGSAITIAPGPTPLKLVIDLGQFTQFVDVMVSLTTATASTVAPQTPSNNSGPDNTIGLLQAPTSGCYLSVGQNVNIRSGGSTGHSIVAVLGAGKYLTVIGYNDNTSSSQEKWYEVMLPDGRIGWIASFVATTGGSCGSLTSKNYPPLSSGPTMTPTTSGSTTPTATSDGSTTPTATATSEFQTAPIDGDYFINLDIKTGSTTLTGQISYPNGDTNDKITYTAVGFDSVTTSGQIQVNVTCSFVGNGNAFVNFSNLGAVGESNCPGATTKFLTNDSDKGFIRIDLTGGQNVLVNWTATFTAIP